MCVCVCVCELFTLLRSIYRNFKIIWNMWKYVNDANFQLVPLIFNICSIWPPMLAYSIISTANNNCIMFSSTHWNEQHVWRRRTPCFFFWCHHWRNYLIQFVFLQFKPIFLQLILKLKLFHRSFSLSLSVSHTHTQIHFVSIFGKIFNCLLNLDTTTRLFPA